MLRRSQLIRFTLLLESPRWYTIRLLTTASRTPLVPPTMVARARSIAAEHEKLSKQLDSSYDVKLAKKKGELSEVVFALREWEHAKKSNEELQSLLTDSSTDPELQSLAVEEADDSAKELERLSTKLKTSLVPAHPFANLPCLLELRPGAGGSEAGIFAHDLLQMYQALCRRLGLRANLIKIDRAEEAKEEQISEAILEVESEGAYGIMRCEAGVHRVQRVPATEKQGRTHTSAASVMVLPSFPDNPADVLGEESSDNPESDYYIDPEDVRVEVMRARGAGGQHVNKTESAVRLTHVPTGTTVSMQDARSQQKNRAKAWQILRSRIAQTRREEREEEQARLRVSIIGVARMGRGDKVRTYNWGQQRVTDHRSGLTLHGLDDVIAGGPLLDEVMQSVRTWMSEQELAALAADENVLKGKSK